MFNHIQYPSSLYQSVYNCIDRIANLTRSFSSSQCDDLHSLYLALYERGFLELSCPEVVVPQSIVSHCQSIHTSFAFAQEFVRQLIERSTHNAMFLSSLLQRYRIDEVNFFVNSYHQNVGSDFWHRDGVGHRLKLFIPVKIVGEPPTTDLFPKSHLLSCRPYNWEMLRVGVDNPSNHAHQSHIEHYYKGLYGDFHSFFWNPHKLLLLDTNSIHRAANFHSGTPGSSRAFLIVEFMDPTASRIGHRFKLGECGLSNNPYLMNLFMSVLSRLS